MSPPSAPVPALGSLGCPLPHMLEHTHRLFCPHLFTPCLPSYTAGLLSTGAGAVACISPPILHTLLLTVSAFGLSDYLPALSEG